MARGQHTYPEDSAIIAAYDIFAVQVEQTFGYDVFAKLGIPAPVRFDHSFSTTKK